MLVIDKQDYQDKALSDTNTYRSINKDPTTKLSNQLINTLKDIKQVDLMTQSKDAPNQCCTPQVYGLPKIHKVGTPLRSIVSSKGSITYGYGKGFGRNHPPFSRAFSIPP